MTWDDYTFTEISISTVVAPFNINIIVLYLSTTVFSYGVG